MNDHTRKKKNSLSIQVPYNFIREKINSLTWRELQYGILTGYTSKQTAIEYAIATISSSEDSKSLHFQLASLYNSELSLVENLLTQIAKEEALQNENEMKRKWVYLIIFWLFSNRGTPVFINDTPPIPLNGLFEMLLVLFEDLEYPVELAGIIGYSDEADESMSYLEAIEKYLVESEKALNK